MQTFASDEMLFFGGHAILCVCLLLFNSGYPRDLFLVTVYFLCFFPGVASFRTGNLAAFFELTVDCGGSSYIDCPNIWAIGGGYPQF